MNLKPKSMQGPIPMNLMAPNMINLPAPQLHALGNQSNMMHSNNMMGHMGQPLGGQNMMHNGSVLGKKRPFPPSAQGPQQPMVPNNNPNNNINSINSNNPKKLKTNSSNVPFIREDLMINLPIFNGRGPCPPLCGPNPAAPDYVMKKGDLVAARITKPKDPNQEWILATITKHANKTKYEVEDVEEEETLNNKGAFTRKKYTLSVDAIIPLPKSLPDPTKRLEFATSRKVLALYPGTTCFYEAEVIAPPSKRRKDNDYLVQFVDDEESDTPTKAIPQMFVLNMPTNQASSP
jgi:hypothetical protein